MSSLSAVQADGYYAPPEYYSSGAYKKQSISQYSGSKGHNQYLQRNVVRFELPYDGFCTKCEAHVGKGTRFNASKTHAGDYFTTKIWEFTTKCRACADCVFKIRTDPKNTSFAYVEGIRMKNETFDTDEARTAGVIDTDAGRGIVPYNVTTVKNSDDDPLCCLEREKDGERKARMEFGRLEAIQSLNSATSKDDAASNYTLRKTYRKARKARKRQLQAASDYGLGKNISLADVNDGDAMQSRHVFSTSEVLDTKARNRESKSFNAIRSGSIFGSGSNQQCKFVKAGSKRVAIKATLSEASAVSSSPPKLKQRIMFKPPSLLEKDGCSIHKKQVQAVPESHKKEKTITTATATATATSTASSTAVSTEASTAHLKKEDSAFAALADYGSDSD